MFSTIVAYITFILISVIFAVVIIEEIRPKSSTYILKKQLENYNRGYVIRTSWRKVGILLAIWFASGYYLWG